MELVVANMEKDVEQQESIKRKILLTVDMINHPEAKELEEWLSNYDTSACEIFTDEEWKFIMEQTIKILNNAFKESSF